MAAYVFAHAVLMGLWLALGVPAGQGLVARVRLPDAQRLTVLLLWIGLGWAALAWLTWRFLPVSALSQGWAREELEGVQQAAWGITALLSVVGGWRLFQRLWPSRPVVVAARAAPAAKKPKAKRRP